MQKISKGYFCVSEGVDCSGKTTNIKSAIEILGNNTTYCKGLCSRTIIGKIVSLYPSTSLFLLEQLYLTYFVIIPNLKKGNIVMQDRYVYSIASYWPDSVKWYNKLLIKIADCFLIKPDIIFYFTVDLNERISRLKQRPSKYHTQLINNPNLIKQRESAYKKLLSYFDGTVVVLDTTNTSQLQNTNQIIEIIKRKCNIHTDSTSFPFLDKCLVS